MNQILQDKYMVIYLPNHHLAKADGYVYVHRMVAEEKLGRKLDKEEFVHHKDEDKLNNSPDNLMVFKSNADHSAFHQGYKAVFEDGVWSCPDLTLIPEEIRKRKNWAKKKCPICNKVYIAKTNEMCINCRKIYRVQNSKCPSKDELSKYIGEIPFVQIGKIYGVSDNAVRKWCKKYGLSFKKNEIKTIKNSI